MSSRKPKRTQQQVIDDLTAAMKVRVLKKDELVQLERALSAKKYREDQRARFGPGQLRASYGLRKAAGDD